MCRIFSIRGNIYHDIAILIFKYDAGIFNGFTALCAHFYTESKYSIIVVGEFMGHAKKDVAFRAINIAVLTVSDTRTPETDTSGDVLQLGVETAGHKVTQRAIVVDDIYFKGRAIAFKQLGYSAAKLGKFDEVEPAYQRAVGLDSSLSSAKLELAEIKYNHQEYADAQVYLDGYRKQVQPASAKALLLGIKLARVYEDKDDEASFALALKNLYPRSAEYLEYIKQIRDSDI